MVEKKFIARGIIELTDYGKGNDNKHMAGRYAFVTQVNHDIYQWDGAHKATHFETAEIALDSAEQCIGPWFNAPRDGTVEAIEVDESWRKEHINFPYPVSTPQEVQPNQRKKNPHGDPQS